MNFIPPLPNPVVIGVARWFLPWFLRRHRLMRVEFVPAELERLRDLGDQRLLLTPNHPTGLDPALIFDLSKRVRQQFHYVGAREIFDWQWGLRGWLLRRCGVYSITRGAVDRQSFKLTRELLVRPGARVVIFPEGETYIQNDTLLPFHEGVLQLAFWAQDDLRETGAADAVAVLPVAVKYKYLEDMRPAIAAALTRLERAVGLPAAGAGNFLDRLQLIGERVVSRLEVEYGQRPDPALALSARMDAMKEAILARVAQGLGVTPPGGPLADRMRFLSNALHTVTDEPPQDPTAYDLRLWDQRRRRVRPLLRDLNRLANWVAVYYGYVAEHPSPERIAELVKQLEMEVFGEVQLVGRQRCLVRLGEPLSLAGYADQYAADKRATVTAVTGRVEAAVAEMLREMR